MSTIALDYPSSVHVRRTANLRLIVFILVGLALVTSVVLVAAATSAKVDSSSGVVAVPIHVAPGVDAQVRPAMTATPAPIPVVIAVPVPEPPSQ